MSHKKLSRICSEIPLRVNTFHGSSVRLLPKCFLDFYRHSSLNYFAVFYKIVTAFSSWVCLWIYLRIFSWMFASVFCLSFSEVPPTILSRKVSRNWFPKSFWICSGFHSRSSEFFSEISTRFQPRFHEVDSQSAPFRKSFQNLSKVSSEISLSSFPGWLCKNFSWSSQHDFPGGFY